jgi:hypothetical protein
MFEATYTITALAESNEQGQRVLRVVKQTNPVDDDEFLALVTRIYEQEVYRTLQVGDSLTMMVHLDLPPREVEKTLRFLGDGWFESEGETKLTTDLHSLMASLFGYYRQYVQAGDLLTISFKVQRL